MSSTSGIIKKVNRWIRTFQSRKDKEGGAWLWQTIYSVRKEKKHVHSF